MPDPTERWVNEKMNIKPIDPIAEAPVRSPLFGDDTGSEMPSKTGKARHRKLWIWFSIALFALVLLFLSFAEDTADVTEGTAAPPLQLVSVEVISVSPQSAEITALAEVRPRWSADLSASVSGRIDRVFESALAGEPVEVGTPLIEIENSRYRAEFADSELALKQAELALWQAKNATHVARADFKRNQIKPPNDLALKLPQLGIAESAVAAAQARVAAAKRQLDDTVIEAPFPAFVTERFVSPGQSVSVGDRLLNLSDNQHFEIVAEMGRADWALLPKPLAGQIAQVLDQDGEVIAKAQVRRGSGFLDGTTRQFKVYLDIENPEAGEVLAGDFVTVRLSGTTVDTALEVPASAITKEGYLWYVDGEDQLQRAEPEILFRRQNRVIVHRPVDQEHLRVAVTPLVSFLPGQKVQPKLATD